MTNIDFSYAANKKVVTKRQINSQTTGEKQFFKVTMCYSRTKLQVLELGKVLTHTPQKKKQENTNIHRNLLCIYLFMHIFAYLNVLTLVAQCPTYN